MRNVPKQIPKLWKIPYLSKWVRKMQNTWKILAKKQNKYRKNSKQNRKRLQKYFWKKGHIRFTNANQFWKITKKGNFQMCSELYISTIIRKREKARFQPYKNDVNTCSISWYISNSLLQFSLPWKLHVGVWMEWCNSHHYSVVCYYWFIIFSKPQNYQEWPFLVCFPPHMAFSAWGLEKLHNPNKFSERKVWCVRPF